MTEFMITLRKANGSAGTQARYLTFDDASGPEQEMPIMP